jgi:hypothetical protein
MRSAHSGRRALLAAALLIAACDGGPGASQPDSRDAGTTDLRPAEDVAARTDVVDDPIAEVDPGSGEPDLPEIDGTDAPDDVEDAAPEIEDATPEAGPDAAPDAAVPAAECNPELQDCPNGDQLYCSAKGKCLAHPTLGLCPATWKFFKPAVVSELALPAVLDTPTDATITPRIALQAPGTDCAGHPNAMPYLQWADEHRLVPPPTAWPLTLAELHEVTPQADLVCPATFFHLRSWFLRQCSGDLALADLATSTVTAETSTAWTKGDGYVWTRTRFDIPDLGASTGLLAVPDGVGPFPGVLLLHGHFSSADEAFLEQAGASMARAGLVVFAPDSRAYEARIGGDSCEAKIARALWDQTAMPLVGLQLREELSALAYLRARPEVDPARIGINSHSGGAQRAMALALAMPGVRVVARDDDFGSRLYWPCEVQADGECELQPHCTVIPAVTEPVRDALQRQSAVPFVQTTRPYQPLMSPEDATALAVFFADVLSP